VRELFKPLTSYVTDKTQDLDARFDVLNGFFYYMGGIGQNQGGGSWSSPQPLAQGVTQQHIDQNTAQLNIAFYEAIPANGLSDVIWALPQKRSLHAWTTSKNPFVPHVGGQ